MQGWIGFAWAAGTLAIIGVVAAAWRLLHGVFEAEEAVKDVPLLRKEFEEYQVASEASMLKLRNEMLQHMRDLEHANEQRAERVQTEVEGRFQLLTVALANINQQLGVISNDVSWLRKGYREHEEPKR